MSNTRKLVGAATVALAAAAGALALDGAGDTTNQANAIDAPRTLTLSWPFDNGGKGKMRQVDLGKKGLGPGDMFFFAGVPLRDVQTGRRVGSFEGTETILSPAHDGTVNWSITLRLRDGRIQLESVIRHTDRPNTYAITGGTGAYANVRGEMTEREDNRRKATSLHLKLMP